MSIAEDCIRVKSKVFVGKFFPSGFCENTYPYGFVFFQAEPPKLTFGRTFITELAHPDPVVKDVPGVHSQTASGTLGEARDLVLNLNHRDRKLNDRKIASILMTRVMLVVRTKSGFGEPEFKNDGAPILVRNSVHLFESNMLLGIP